jgi:hypothetical protein
MIKFRALLSAAALAVLLPATVQAACTDPAGDEGDLVYNQGWRIAQYCDGTNWQAAMKAAAPRTGDCTDPVRGEGAIIYNEDDNVPQVCIGGWRALGPINPAAGTGGCSSPTKDEGTVIYNSDDNVMQYCDGSQWVKLLGPAPENCPNVGDICIDGSVYAGLSPAGAGTERMYVPRCDAGMSYNGVLCQGIRSSLPWNNGNNSNYTYWGSSSDNDGGGNTDFLILFDSDSDVAGVQPHLAAQHCADLVLHGRDDWYLPAKDELSVIYEGLVDGTPNDDSPDPLLDGFATNGDFYWSSSENTVSAAWRQRFSDGSPDLRSKLTTIAVRCARR